MEDIKIRRLGWEGHIIRMEEERILNKVLMKTSIPQDLWEDQELDGRTWRCLMREAKARKGL
jgi:hypothetical protein